jgi:urease beta subunit
MNRPVGTAMQTKPGTEMICGVIRLEGMSRLVGTAMQTKPGTDMICEMICRCRAVHRCLDSAVSLRAM